MAVLCCRQFIMAYDTGSMNVAISTIVADLDITLTGVQPLSLASRNQRHTCGRRLWVERRPARVLQRRECSVKATKMLARITGTVLLSLVVFVVVSLLVSLGVVWLTDGVLRGAVIGVVCGFAAAFVTSTVSVAVGQNEGRPRRRAGDRSGGPEDEVDRRTRLARPRYRAAMRRAA